MLCVQYGSGLKVVGIDKDEVRTVFIVFFIVFEPLRLWAGYWGNLKEQVRPAATRLPAAPLGTTGSDVMVHHCNLCSWQPCTSIPMSLNNFVLAFL